MVIDKKNGTRSEGRRVAVKNMRAVHNQLLISQP